MALTDDEIRLIGRLTADAAETAARFRQQGTIILFGAGAVAVVAAARGLWPLVPLSLALGAGIFALGRLAAKRSSPERAKPVLRALHEAPERVRTIEHMVTSDSRKIFVHHWVVVKTDDGLLRVRAEDWETLLSAIARRCPGATVIGR
jgi:hypothetical protein